jgi:hypothetical protein
MTNNIQKFIIKGLFENPEYFKNVILNIKPTYFSEELNIIVKILRYYYEKYDKIPDYSIVFNMISKHTKSETLIENVETSIKEITSLDFQPKIQGDWLLDQTKLYVSDKAIEEVLFEGVEELKKEGNEKNYNRIHKLMQDAVSIDWNEDLGIEYSDLDQFDMVYDYLEDTNIRIPIGIDSIDDELGGGIPGNTAHLCVFAGAAGSGKCVTYINTIKVRNKTTGEIKVMQIGDFHNKVAKSNENIGVCNK